VFYTKITALGGSNAYFGSWTVNVGCFPGSVTFTDAGNFVTNVNLYVGDSVSNIYTFNQPSSNRAWCVKTANAIVNPDATGTTWTGATKINACGSQPCNVFSLVDTINPEVVTFKVKTTWTNSLTKLSPQATITITCSSAYTITE